MKRTLSILLVVSLMTLMSIGSTAEELQVLEGQTVIEEQTTPISPSEAVQEPALEPASEAQPVIEEQTTPISQSEAVQEPALESGTKEESNSKPENSLDTAVEGKSPMPTPEEVKIENAVSDADMLEKPDDADKQENVITTEETIQPQIYTLTVMLFDENEILLPICEELSQNPYTVQVEQGAVYRIDLPEIEGFECTVEECVITMGDCDQEANVIYRERKLTDLSDLITETTPETTYTLTVTLVDEHGTPLPVSKFLPANPYFLQVGQNTELQVQLPEVIGYICSIEKCVVRIADQNDNIEILYTQSDTDTKKQASAKQQLAEIITLDDHLDEITLQEDEPYVTIRCEQGDTVEARSSITLIAELNGFDGINVKLQWQGFNGRVWEDIAGASQQKLVIENISDWNYNDISVEVTLI